LSKVLVTDGSKREALAIIRSLGRKGIEVTAADSSCFNAGFLSRYSKHRILYPSPERSKTRFVKSLLELVKREKFDLLIPVTDFTVMPISEHKEDFEKYVRVAAPEYETLLKAFDKALTVQIAAERNIPHPKTFILEDVKCIREVAKEINYPAVIKPRMRVMWTSDQATTLKVTQRNYACDRFDLMTKYSRIAAMLEKIGVNDHLPMVQEYVVGEGCGVEALMYNSELKALFMHRRLREYPISGGASTLRESMNDGKLGNLGVELLKAMRWNGVAMVEFKVDKLNGEPKLMEVNGRFWGSLALAIAAGVDFPYLLYKIAVKGEEVNLPSYREKVKQRWLIPGDILWLFSSILHTEGKFGSIENFVKAFTVPDDIIELNDLVPAFGALVNMLNDGIDVISGRRTVEGEIVF